MGQHYEGTWEEIVKHADELRGKLVTVTTYDAPPPLTPGEQTASIADFEQLMVEIDRHPFPRIEAPTEPDPYGDALIEKFRKQGLDL